MKLVVCVFLVGLLQLSSSVTVTEGDYKFSLESVKELGALINEVEASAEQELQLQLLQAKVVSVCSHPALPKDFKPLCLSKDAGAALTRLASVATHYHSCQICESVACTGC